LQKHVEDKLSDAMISGSVEGQSEIEIYCESGDLEVRALKVDQDTKYMIKTEGLKHQFSFKMESMPSLQNGVLFMFWSFKNV
jgi:hypothetical protein